MVISAALIIFGISDVDVDAICRFEATMSDNANRERFFVCDGEDYHLVSSQKEAEELCETSLRMYAEEAASDGEWSSDVDGGIYWGIVAGKSMPVFGFEDVDNGETIDIIETVDFKMTNLPPIVEES